MSASARWTISKKQNENLWSGCRVMTIWPYDHMAIWPYGHMTIWPYGLINVGLSQMDHQQKTEWEYMVWLPSYDHMAIWPYGLINVGLGQTDHQQKTEWEYMVWLSSYDHMAIWPYGQMTIWPYGLINVGLAPTVWLPSYGGASKTLRTDRHSAFYIGILTLLCAHCHQFLIVSRHKQKIVFGGFGGIIVISTTKHFINVKVIPLNDSLYCPGDRSTVKI